MSRFLRYALEWLRSVSARQRLRRIACWITGCKAVGVGVIEQRRVCDGRVKALGAANWRARRIRKANDYASRTGKTGFVATQLFWNLGSRHYRGLESTLRPMDDDAEQLHQAANLVAMPYSSQAGGFFSNWLEGDDATRLKAERSGYATKASFQIARLAGEIA